MELGAVQPAGSAGHGDGTQPAQRRRWATLGAALLAGAVIGIVANNARNDAAEYDEADLVRGTVFVETEPPLASGPQRVTVNLINTGSREIEILDIAIIGFESVDDVTEETVTAEPGVWVAARATVRADCDTRPPGTIDVRVRTGSGERTVVIEGQPGDDQLTWAWQYGCDTPPESGVFIGDTRTVSADARGAHIVLPISNGTDEPIEILRLEGTTPGFALATATIPIEIPAGQLVDVATTWTVSDCEAAARFTDATVAVNVGRGDMESRITQPLGNSTLIELVRLAVRVCES